MDSKFSDFHSGFLSFQSSSIVSLSYKNQSTVCYMLFYYLFHISVKMLIIVWSLNIKMVLLSDEQFFLKDIARVHI